MFISMEEKFTCHADTILIFSMSSMAFISSTKLIVCGRKMEIKAERFKVQSDWWMPIVQSMYLLSMYLLQILSVWRYVGNHIYVSYGFHFFSLGCILMLFSTTYFVDPGKFCIRVSRSFVSGGVGVLCEEGLSVALSHGKSIVLAYNIFSWTRSESSSIWKTTKRSRVYRIGLVFISDVKCYAKKSVPPVWSTVCLLWSLNLM